MKDLFKSIIEKLDLIKISVAIMSLFLLAFMCYALVYVEIPTSNKEALYIIIGILSSTVSMIAGFYYGSSKGSQKKDDVISKMTDQAGNTTPKE